MKEKIVQVAFSDVEISGLNWICEKLGCNRSELIRRLVSQMYLKLNPPYKGTPRDIKEEGPEMTAEQQCEAAGGHVEPVNGIMMCHFRHGSGYKNVPLTMPDKFSAEW